MTYYPRLPGDRSKIVRADVEQQLQSGFWKSNDIYNYYMQVRDRDPVIVRSGVRSSDAFRQREASFVNKRNAEFVTEWTDKQIASEQLRHSIAGRFGHLIEPAIRPLGFDWKMGVGLVGAFAAREVFVSTMGITYAVGDTEESGTADLSKAMQADRYPDGRPVWTPLVAVSLLVWFVLAMQCMSTVAIVRRETGGWKWPIFMIVYMNSLAYVVALGVYQIGSRIGS